MNRSFVAQFVLVCGIAFATVSGLRAEEPKGPVGIWKFDEDSGNAVKDTSGNGNDGSILLPERQDVVRAEGKIGKALQFNGANLAGGAVVIPGLCKKYDFFQKGLTIETWVKFGAANLAKGQHEIVSNTQSDNGTGFRLKFNNQWLYFHAGDGTKVWGLNQDVIKHPIKADTWYFITAVYDGTAFKLYMDGELAATAPVPALTPGNDNLYIGGYKGGAAYRFDGIIDEVKVYDYARTDAQILSDARAE